MSSPDQNRFDDAAADPSPCYTPCEERVVPLRLQRFLARAGVASRRGSEDLMTAGRVTVNGVVVTELGSKVDPRIDEVRVDGQLVKWGQGPVFILLNKPAGFLTTMSDPHGRPCVASLVPVQSHPGLFPVGRLDQDTTGALLFSTDGTLANALLHPSHQVVKRYEVLCHGKVHERELDLLRAGIELEDGMTAPAQLSFEHLVQGKGGVCSQVTCCIHEGRKRQVKRMFEAIGHPVASLHRASFGPIGVEGLATGQWRLLTEAEVASLRAVAGTVPQSSKRASQGKPPRP